MAEEAYEIEWDDETGSPMQENDDEDERVQEECLNVLSTDDSIMEPGVFQVLKRFLQAGGSPERVVELLSNNYIAVAQCVNLLAEWLILVGADYKEVQERVETYLKEMILKCFDPKKADSIFSVEGEVPSWLAEMVEFSTWRTLFYKLAEEYPDCLMLNFTIKLISDAGYQGEITSVSTACHQIEVFSRVLRTSITTFLEGGEEALEKNLPEFTKMVCHGEHTYLYSQVLMQLLSQEIKGGSNLRRLCQELQKCANDRGLDVTPITMALSGAAAYPRACQALSCMLSRQSLNPADITILFKRYSEGNPPPVELIRVPAFLELLIEALFKPGSRTINREHKPKYIYLLAYAASVNDTYKKGVRKYVNKDELKPTVQALEKTQTLCSENKGSSELIADINTLFQCIRFSVVAMGVLRWVDYTVSDKSYFKLNTDHTPLHLVLVDEIVTSHMLLHQKALDLLIRLFEASYEELDVLVRLELKKTVLDRMVHVFSRGCVIPVVSYIRKCLEKQDTDISLIRHFVTEVLDMITPPYTAEFVQLLLPLIENEDITGSLKVEDGTDPVTEFIAHCRSNYIMVT
ncbi:negative elongation factor D-like [Octopus vulgaris]|uniref:Negative elongation factor D-like n=4 Tax=Octopus TaxID=6643 RepID=A0AA36AKG3_OCTVU|nr:negative elongation factor D isoform X1 [Octopus bimaculoides]XP_029658469.1 negative elongation factor D [Octopus sinensis]CAI9717071.1 negative elongation factor D-like [Octopus vulgaris]|eukprot:XP_014790375.1 PREDICTED: negative elongation factor C/D-like [Octopus bimaculoides]